MAKKTTTRKQKPSRLFSLEMKEKNVKKLLGQI